MFPSGNRLFQLFPSENHSRKVLGFYCERPRRKWALLNMAAAADGLVIFAVLWVFSCRSLVPRAQFWRHEKRGDGPRFRMLRVNRTAVLALLIISSSVFLLFQLHYYRKYVSKVSHSRVNAFVWCERLPVWPNLKVCDVTNEPLKLKALCPFRI